MLLLKFCIDHMGLKLICGVLVSLPIFFYVEVDPFGLVQSLAYSELSLKPILALMKPLGLLYPLRQLIL